MLDTTLLILLGLACARPVSATDTTVAVSILKFLIIIRVTPRSAFSRGWKNRGYSIGIIILTISVMAPIASDIARQHAYPSFGNWKSLVAIAVGVFVSWQRRARRDADGRSTPSGGGFC